MNLFDCPHKVVCCSMAGLPTSGCRLHRAVHGGMLLCCKRLGELKGGHHHTLPLRERSRGRESVVAVYDRACKLRHQLLHL